MSIEEVTQNANKIQQNESSPGQTGMKISRHCQNLQCKIEVIPTEPLKQSFWEVCK
jgi:hypothetical protein